MINKISQVESIANHTINMNRLCGGKLPSADEVYAIVEWALNSPTSDLKMSSKEISDASESLCRYHGIN